MLNMYINHFVTKIRHLTVSTNLKKKRIKTDDVLRNYSVWCPQSGPTVNQDFHSNI